MEKQYKSAEEQQRIYNKKQARLEAIQKLKFERIILESIMAQEVWEAKAFKYFPD